MGELPVFTTNAHVFTIDPKTKKTWISSSSSSVAINYFFDPTKNCYRIVSIEDIEGGKKVVINSTLTEKMTFKKTSQKFGQWTDSKQSTIYGLGFNSEDDLDKFVGQFKMCVEMMKKRASGDENAQRKETNLKVVNDSGNVGGITNNRQWSSRSGQSNLNNSIGGQSERSIEKMQQMIDEMKIEHQIQIEKLRDEYERENVNALTTSVDNLKATKDYRTRISELEIENRDLKRRIKNAESNPSLVALANENASNNLRVQNEVQELVKYHQKVDAIISQLNSNHVTVGKHISEIIGLVSKQAQQPQQQQVAMLSANTPSPNNNNISGSSSVISHNTNMNNTNTSITTTESNPNQPTTTTTNSSNSNTNNNNSKHQFTNNCNTTNNLLASNNISSYQSLPPKAANNNNTSSNHGNNLSNNFGV